jgi:hypothetical protein
MPIYFDWIIGLIKKEALFRQLECTRILKAKITSLELKN